MKRLVVVMLLVTLIPIGAAASFPTHNQNPGFSGFTEGSVQGLGEFRMSYPGISAGEDVPMAQNGPFATVVFYPDDGEEVDQYIWLQDELARWGFITLVVQPDQVDWLKVKRKLTEMNNGTCPVDGCLSMFALSHISLGGHGTGAHLAAEIVRSNQYNLSGLFGLSLEGTSTDYQNPATVLTRPAVALFLTGTTDEIAPANENIIPYVEDWPGAWQVMHPLGANHIGYQEDDTFLERWNDGDGNMSREIQQQHALNHILPYLNLTLKGDAAAYQAAFNREDKSVSSDSDAYIDEDLSRSRLYNLTDMSISLNSISMTDDFTISANVTQRNGLPAIGNVSCIFPDQTIISGNISSGKASCDLTGELLDPGLQIVTLKVHDNSFSDWHDFSVIRVGTPIVLVEPMPNVILYQHGNISVNVSTLATDPDGLDIYLASAELIGDEENRLGLSHGSMDFTISHEADQEWSGSVLLDLVLVAGLDDSVNVTLIVTVIPVDDQVVSFDLVGTQQTEEDGENIIIDLANYVSDPEGATLVIEPNTYPDLRIVATDSVILIDPHPHVNGAELVEVSVSDGTTAPIVVVIPIDITSVDDSIEFENENQTFTLDEDQTLVIDLSDLVIDYDDDQLTWQLEGSSPLFGTSIIGQQLTIAGNPNLHGQDYLTLNVSDGTSTDILNVTVKVKSVADSPTVAISSLSAINGDISLLWTINDDDGVEGLIFNITLDGEAVDDETECTGTTHATCASYFSRKGTDSGWKKVEVKVWDSQAQEWSNIDFESYDFSKVQLEETIESSEEIPAWLLPIGMAVVVGLLLALLSRKKR
ncbi:MAG: Ig-like domain-containing protein [Candidatus Poseidoniales archaeon]